MSESIQFIHLIMRTIHISLGFAGLGLFWLIVALPKGSALHVKCGRSFAAITWLVGGTAMLSSLWALTHLDSFAPMVRQSEQPWVREMYYLIFAILLYLSVATVSGAVFGVQVMRTRQRHEDLRQTVLPIWLFITGLCAAGLIVFGMGRLMINACDGSLSQAAYSIPIFVGLFGTAAAWNEWRYVFGPPPPEGAWLYQHVWQMCGTGIAFHTAFFVFGANRMFGFQLPGAWALAPWVAPPVIGLSLTSLYIRSLRAAAVDRNQSNLT